MTFAWHCRECDEHGEAVVPLDEKIMPYLVEAEQSFLTALCLFVKRTIHTSCGENAKIGLRAL